MRHKETQLKILEQLKEREGELLSMQQVYENQLAHLKGAMSLFRSEEMLAHGEEKNLNGKLGIYTQIYILILFLYDLDVGYIYCYDAL